MPVTHYRACHLCEAICGLKIEVDAGKIVSIRGDDNDPLSRGHICPKAIALQDLHEDPDRLRGPVKRVIGSNGEAHWEDIDWEQALQETAERLAATYREHGVDAIGAYFGNPSVHNYGMLTHQGALFSQIRTNNRFSATSVDQLPHHLVALWLFGHKLMFPIADIDRCDYFLMLGANPIASNGSIWTVPDVRRRIKALTARGGRLVVIDPRRTETAELATEHHFIRPGTDAAFLAALLNTLFEEDLGRSTHLGAFTTGLDAVRDACGGIDAAAAANFCGIDADTIRRIARDLAAAEAGICYGRMGVSTQAFGTLCQWLIHMINIVTGNLDREGGLLFTKPAFDNVANSGRGGFGRHRSRVRGLPEFDRELPAAAMAEEITTPGEGQIHALFTGAGNPVLSTPDGAALDRALESLSFMVSLDPYINETTRHADIILPPTSPLEHDHYDIGFHTNAVRNTARMNEPVFDKPEGALHDWEIFNELGRRFAELVGNDWRPTPEPRHLIDMGLQAGPYAAMGLSLAELAENPSGVDLGPLEPCLPERLFTPDKLIHCATPEALADLNRLADSMQAGDNGLRLIGRRHVRDCNSWMHNFYRLVKGRDRCTALIHPDDLADRGINDGDWVTVRSRSGEVSLRCESSRDVMRGVVSIPHGYGHQRAGIRARIAKKHAGVSCNDITDAGFLDQLSGNAAVNGVAVEVFPCTATLQSG
jgi:anaerobic selenocysteine-containing dehydrogenase